MSNWMQSRTPEERKAITVFGENQSIIYNLIGFVPNNEPLFITEYLLAAPQSINLYLSTNLSMLYW